MREELKGKLPRWVFTVFVASSGAFLVFLAVTLLHMNDKALVKIEDISTQIGAVKIESAVTAARQQIIIDKLEKEEEDGESILR